MEDKETLKSSAHIRQFPDSVKDKINNLLSNGVVATGVVVGSILFTSDELLRMEQLSVSASANLVCWKNGLSFI